MHKLGETDFSNEQTESWSGKLGGTNFLFREAKIIATGNREFAAPSRWGAEFYFRFWTYLELRKWLRALEDITKHFEQVDH